VLFRSSAWPDAELGLVFSANLHESAEAFVRRIAHTVALYRLPPSTIKRPAGLEGHQLAFGDGTRWRIVAEAEADFEFEAGERIVYVGGPLTAQLLDDLMAAETATVVVDDPSRLFVPWAHARRAEDQGMAIELRARPDVIFVAVRSDGGHGRALPPKRTLALLAEEFGGDPPCFDPWLVAPAKEAA